MSIRTRLALTFIGLIVFGVTAIASYAILFIREYLEEEGARQMQADSAVLATALEGVPCSGLGTKLAELEGQVSYTITLQRAGGASLLTGLPVAPPTPEVLRIARNLHGFACADAAVLSISRAKEDLYKPIKRIRWIIYSGMFVSIALVVVVSTLSARSIARPILQLARTAEGIAGGDTRQKLALKRKDEIGQLASSLNRMAEQLRADNERLQAQATREQQFYADIAHEVRNPLHTVMATLEMLELEGATPEDRARYHSVAQRQLERIRRLFDDLMLLQRAGEDPNFIRPVSTDLGQICAGLAETYLPQAQQKGLALHIQCTPQLVWADPARLEQVLDNLLGNAIKYTQAGEVRLSYQLKGTSVQIEVSDTGQGIAPEHLPHIFDRFYRAEASRSRAEGGTGLGLAVVQRILGAHGSQIQVQSTVQVGTRFLWSLAIEPNPA